MVLFYSLFSSELIDLKFFNPNIKHLINFYLIFHCNCVLFGFVFKILCLKFISKMSLSKRHLQPLGAGTAENMTGCVVATICGGSWWEDWDEERNGLYKTLPRGQSLNVCFSYLKVLIQIVSIILIVLLSIREKERNLLILLLWLWGRPCGCGCQHAARSKAWTVISSSALVNTPPLQLDINNLPWTHWKWVQDPLDILSEYPFLSVLSKELKEKTPLEDSFLSIYSLESILTTNYLLANQAIFPEIRERTTFILKYSSFNYGC